MVVLYVKGQRIGPLEETAQQLSDLVARREDVELRDENGAMLGKYEWKAESLCPWHPEWTQADLDRMSAAGGGLPLSEVLKRLGAE